MSQRFVVLSTNYNPNYCFYAPLTAAAWRAAGWKVAMLLCGPADELHNESLGRMVEEEIVRQSDIMILPGPWSQTEVASATVAQLSRIFACNADSLEQSDFLLTSDVDMWPVGGWVGHSDSPKFQLYNAFAYQDQKHVQYPMCYVGGRVEQWRTVVGGGTLAQSLSRGLDAFAAASQTWDDGERKVRAWDFDERYLGQLIANASGVVPMCGIARNMGHHGQRRLDRSSWRVPVRLEGYADVHLPRPGYREFWPSVRRTFSMLAPNALKWADIYYSKWIKEST